MLSEQELAAIEARNQARTAGEWEASPSSYASYEGDGWNIYGDDFVCAAGFSYDADFIAHAPADITALLADRKELQAQLEMMEKLCGIADESAESLRIENEKLRKELYG